MSGADGIGAKPKIPRLPPEVTTSAVERSNLDANEVNELGRIAARALGNTEIRIETNEEAKVVEAILRKVVANPEAAIQNLRRYGAQMMVDFDARRRSGDAPELLWKPSFLQSTKPLRRSGPILGSPFSTLEAGLFAVDRLRREKTDGIFLLTSTPAGYSVFEYGEKRLGKVDLSELRIDGLPLGGDPFDPRTFIVDGKGRLGKIDRLGDGYVLSDIDPKDAPKDVKALHLPAVAPHPQTNHGRNVTWSPKLAFRPSSDIDELSSILRHVHDHLPKDVKVKAGGSRHSWSKTAVSNHVYIHPEGMKLFENLGDNLVRVGSGNTIRETNRFLWEHGKSIPSLGGYDGQTLGGVLPTGTHGSVFTRGPIAEAVRSIDLVTAKGDKVRIERSPGITDPESFHESHPGWRLIQDDAYLDAALVNMGTMGVVHSYVLEVTDAFHMKEVRTETTLLEMKAKLAGGRLYDLAGAVGTPKEIAERDPKISNGRDGGFEGHPLGAYHFELLINPHSDKVIVTSRHPTVVEEDDQKKLEFTPPGRNLVRTLERGAKFTRPALPTWISEHLADAVAWTTDQIAKLVPKATPWLLDRALSTMSDDAYVDRSFNVFHIGDGANHIPALSGTLYVPVEKDMYLEAVDVIQRVAADFARRGKYETGPISLRFIKGTGAMLGSPKDMTSFELIFTRGTEHAQEMIDAYDKALRARFGDEVRVHWGQMMRTPGPEQIARMHPRFDEWKRIRRELDPDRRFLNDWQEALIGS